MILSRNNNPVTERIRQFQRLLKENHLDSYLVNKDTNIRYLTGFKASESWLLVTQKKSYYITDFRYILEAKKALKNQAMVIQYTKSMAQALFDLAKDLKIKSIGFDDRHLTLAMFNNLRKSCLKGISLRSVNNLVESLRMIKDAREIKLIKKALEIHASALTYLHKIVQPGQAENSILLKLESFVKQKNVGFSFDPIIAGGPNSCLPHAHVTQRVIKKNDIVLVDMGIDVNGYKSDLTRMFFFGKISKLIKDVEVAVKDAQRQAIAMIKAGVRVSEVDLQARKCLAKKGLEEYFGHSLGHGVGLDIHEAPRLSQLSSEILQEGMVVTVEPAVYLPNKFGIRIEDMVLVTKNGCEVLSDNID